MSEPVWGDPLPLDPELIAAARRTLASGGSLDDAAAALLKLTPSPISVIKALRATEDGLTLSDAKWVVHRNLSSAQRDAAERLWDELERIADGQDDG